MHLNSASQAYLKHEIIVTDGFDDSRGHLLTQKHRLLGKRKRMGQAASKKARHAAILKNETRCCLCEGSRQAITIDHVPARVCFIGKAGPEEFEFPSCLQCNNLSSRSEQVTGLYIRISDHDEKNFSGKELNKLITGVANNDPDCLPLMLVQKNKLRELRDNFPHNRGKFLADINAAGIPDRVHFHLEIFARKLIYAIHYKKTGAILGRSHELYITYCQVGTYDHKYLEKFANSRFGPAFTTKRSNVNIRDQFIFNHAYNERHGFSGLYAQFGKSFCFFCIAIPTIYKSKLDFDTIPYRRIRDLFED
jgi:hypothetical protein